MKDKKDKYLDNNVQVYFSKKEKQMLKEHMHTKTYEIALSKFIRELVLSHPSLEYLFKIKK